MRYEIITYHNAINYGAMLQAYALQTFLTGRGSSCKILNFGKIPDKIVNIRQERIRGVFKIPYYLALRNLYGKFRELKTRTSYPDILLVGSDQVWNPLKIKPEFYADFAPASIYKASYAASIGISKIPSDRVEKFTKLIGYMDKISVREKDAKILLNNITRNEDISVNVDPVFLLDKEDWAKLEKPYEVDKKYGKYIFCYILYRDPWLNQRLKQISQQTGLKVIVVELGGYRDIYHHKMIRDAGPEEFLSLLHHAELVITSSFHGTALSILYGKPFYTVVNPNANSRIINILERFSLKERILNPQCEIKLKAPDYQAIQKVLYNEREKTENYFEKIESEVLNKRG